MKRKLFIAQKKHCTVVVYIDAREQAAWSQIPALSDLSDLLNLFMPQFPQYKIRIVIVQPCEIM